MISQTFGLAQLALRLTFGAVIGYSALLHTSVSAASANDGLMSSGQSTVPLFLSVQAVTPIVLHALLAMTAIWLLFGVRTRIVALLALACYAAVFWLESASGFSNVLDLLVPFQIVALLALPLIAFGGGHFSMYRAGWRNPL